MPPMLRSAEAARRLGVKLPTLYAYVSRGLLAAERAPDGRHSLFHLEDVEALAKRSRGGRASEMRLASVTTSVTQLRDGGPVYRGRPATSLATSAPFEEVAEVLWDVPPPAPVPWAPWPLRPPARLGALDRLRWVAVMAGAADPLRSDLRPEAVTATARRVIATAARVLGPRQPGGALAPGPSVAAVLASALVPSAAAVPAVTPVVDAALVLLADHELATSTVAVRVAASTRADLYDALSAGLGVLAGPLHGGASRSAFAMLKDAERLGPERALEETLRWQGTLPGFGHLVYKAGDARFGVLWQLVEPVASAAQWRTLRAMVELADERRIPAPNIDLALAALAWVTGMPDDAGGTIFAVARMAGWAAHYLEELGERPVRFRARAVYAGRS